MLFSARTVAFVDVLEGGVGGKVEVVTCSSKKSSKDEDDPGVAGVAVVAKLAGGGAETGVGREDADSKKLRRDGEDGAADTVAGAGVVDELADGCFLGESTSNKLSRTSSNSRVAEAPSPVWRWEEASRCGDTG